MRKVWAKITCLHCECEIVKVVNTILNPNVNSDTDRMILEDEWFTTPCPKCHQPVKFIYPSIYKDTKRKMLIFIKEKAIVDEPHLRKRYVNDIQALKELICILKDELDDQAVVKIKKLLKNKNQCQEVHYLEADDEYLFFEVEGRIQGVPKEAYFKRQMEDPCTEVLRYE